MRHADALRIGLLGGTLDPVHLGHVAAAQAARRALALDHVWLMPAHVPSHRGAPGASGWHRFAMAAMAVEDEAGLGVTDLELARTGTTYTSDTLEALSVAGFRPSQLYFITGADAFSAIASWHRYPQLLERAHFVVVTRPGHALAPEAVWPAEVSSRVAKITSEGVTDPPASPEEATRVWLVEARTPDVSSSVVRDRVRAGGDIDQFVRPRVAAHIRRHGLYEAGASARTLHGEH